MNVFAVMTDGGDGGASRADLTGDWEDVRLGSGGGGFSWTLMHSLSSSPSNIVSMARFLDRVGEWDCERSRGGVFALVVVVVVVVVVMEMDDFVMVETSGGEGFPSVCDSSSSSVMSLCSNSSSSDSGESAIIIVVIVFSLSLLLLFCGDVDSILPPHLPVRIFPTVANSRRL